MTGTKPITSNKTAIAIFVKFPVPGRVKTRLAKDIGDTRATEIYEKMVSHLIDYSIKPLAPADFEVIFFCDPYRPQKDYEKYFSNSPYEIRMQEGADLGERLKNAFQTLCGRYHSVVVIGTDCPSLSPAHLEETRKELQNTDVVLGPTEDGGYYLIGLKEYEERLFEDIAWSTNKVLEQTLERAKFRGLDVHLMEVLRDVDTAEDLFSLLR